MDTFFWIPVSWYSFWQLCQSTTSQKVASLSSEGHLAFVVQGQILWAIFAHICLQLMLFQKRNKDCFQVRSTISTVKCFKKRTHSNRRITSSWDNFLIGQNLLVTLRHLDTNDEKALLGEVQRVQQSINPIRPIRRCAWVGERFVQFCGECPNQTILQMCARSALFISHHITLILPRLSQLCDQTASSPTHGLMLPGIPPCSNVQRLHQKRTQPAVKHTSKTTLNLSTRRFLHVSFTLFLLVGSSFNSNSWTLPRLSMTYLFLHFHNWSATFYDWDIAFFIRDRPLHNWDIAFSIKSTPFHSWDMALTTRDRPVSWECLCTLSPAVHIRNPFRTVQIHSYRKSFAHLAVPIRN